MAYDVQFSIGGEDENRIFSEGGSPSQILLNVLASRQYPASFEGQHIGGELSIYNFRVSAERNIRKDSRTLEVLSEIGFKLVEQEVGARK